MKIHSLVAEFAGTFALLMSILLTGNFAVIGATLALVIYLIGNTSGAHVNPAVSVALFLNGTLNAEEFVGYTAAQMSAGVVAYLAYRTFGGPRV
jgi:aquaporin Z